MSVILDACNKRFGEHRVQTIAPKNDNEIELLLIDLELRSPVKVLLTNGLSNYTMPVPEKLKNHNHCELLFCLPSYWELDSSDDKYQWPFEWIHKLANHLIYKETWYGHGHTFANGNPPKPFSSTMKQNHLLLCDPILLEEQFAPIELNDRNIDFLAIVPLFDDEFEYKGNKGSFKFLKKFRAKNYNEVLDDFRETCLKSRLRFY